MATLTEFSRQININNDFGFRHSLRTEVAVFMYVNNEFIRNISSVLYSDSHPNKD